MESPQARGSLDAPGTDSRGALGARDRQQGAGQGGDMDSVSPALPPLPYERPEGESPCTTHLTTAWVHPSTAPVPQPSAGGAGGPLGAPHRGHAARQAARSPSRRAGCREHPAGSCKPRPSSRSARSHVLDSPT